jgi:predicted TIM-barrel fold metal-dependent hydrolase
LDRAVEELDFSRAHGAVGVMMKGQEHGMYLDDPYFSPFLERVQDLDMMICIHNGVSVRRLDAVPIGQIIPTPSALVDHLGAVMKGFWSVLASDLHLRFPRLRWCCMEAGSSWIPFVFQQQQRLAATTIAEGYISTDKGVRPEIARWPVAELMGIRNLYVSCATDEDLPYLTAVAGYERFVLGSDYGHNDVGAEPLGHEVIMARTDLSEQVARAITDGNGRSLYCIPEDFCPSERSSVRGAETVSRQRDSRTLT